MNLKQQAAVQALKTVTSGMTLGLGTGSTTTYFIEMLGEHLNQGILQNIHAVPTSEKTADLARTLGIPLTTLEKNQIDLAVDGADDVDPQLDLIKGLGRALLREKIVEIHAHRFIVIVDEDVPCDQMGWVGRAYTEGEVVDGRRDFAALQIAFRNDIETGVFLADRIQGMTVDGLVNTADGVDVFHAREGEITVDDVSNGRVTGSFSVAFADSGVAGNFEAKECVNLF